MRLDWLDWFPAAANPLGIRGHKGARVKVLDSDSVSDSQRRGKKERKEKGKKKHWLCRTTGPCRVTWVIRNRNLASRTFELLPMSRSFRRNCKQTPGSRSHYNAILPRYTVQLLGHKKTTQKISRDHFYNTTWNYRWKYRYEMMLKWYEIAVRSFHVKDSRIYLWTKQLVTIISFTFLPNNLHVVTS